MNWWTRLWEVYGDDPTGCFANYKQQNDREWADDDPLVADLENTRPSPLHLLCKPLGDVADGGGAGDSGTDQVERPGVHDWQACPERHLAELELVELAFKLKDEIFLHCRVQRE